ncbi:MAG: iron-containing alcohol dehydrogenase [Saprospiraceae bacterium]|nr:iron-containing alcohol dehydrogenase [Saprospiraceae bacterium]
MHDFNTLVSFSFPTNILFGCGAVRSLGPHLKDKGMSRPLIVTDKNVAQLDFFKSIVKNLENQGFSIQVFFDIHKNPVKSDVLAGGEYYIKTNRDCIIGIGGGAGMDVARAIALRINHHRDLFDYDDLEGGDKYVTESVPYFVTIPTTSGTGSEVGRSAIISEDDTKRKRILFSPKLLASQVFADPELTYDLPPFVTAATGMDALTHNMEAYLAKGYHPMADGIAIKAIKMISDSIEDAVNNPRNAKARGEMMLASLMGAVAFQKGLGIVHATAHPLSTLLDMHHGLANSMMLPYGMEYNLPGLEDKFKLMETALGTNKSVYNYLHELKSCLGLPDKLSDLNVTVNHLDRLTELAYNDFCLPANPRKAGKNELREIYEKAL